MRNCAAKIWPAGVLVSRTKTHAMQPPCSRARTPRQQRQRRRDCRRVRGLFGCYSEVVNDQKKSSSDTTRSVLQSAQELNTEDFLLALRGGEQKEALQLALTNETIQTALDKV